MRTEKMVHMVNQIAAFFEAYPHDEAVEGIVGHLRDFWEPRMREALTAHMNAGGEGVSPLVREAHGMLEKKE